MHPGWPSACGWSVTAHPACAAVVGLVASTFSTQAGSGVPPSELVTHIDRVQAARLFAGQVRLAFPSRLAPLLAHPSSPPPLPREGFLSYQCCELHGSRLCKQLPFPAPPAPATSSFPQNSATLVCVQVEYGYFCAGMEAQCRQQGVELGEDSSQLVAFAATLPKDELRCVLWVQSWHQRQVG